MKVKRIDKSLPLPQYATSGSVGLDLYVREHTTVKPNEWALVKLNIVAQCPKGSFLALLPRSSMFKKTGLILANNMGIIDQDYCGPEDEICAIVYNTSNTSHVQLQKGDRLFQLLVINCKTPEIVEIEEDLQEFSRGGHGSTGEGKL